MLDYKILVGDKDKVLFQNVAFISGRLYLQYRLLMPLLLLLLNDLMNA